MPTYEYQCQKCGHILESFQKMSDDPLKTCPKCNKDELQRLISAPNFHLKGAGWYVTDFKDKPAEPQKDKNDGKDSASDENKSAKSTDANADTTRKADKTSSDAKTGAAASTSTGKKGSVDSGKES